MIIRDLKLYAPAIDGWINLIGTSGGQELGELMPKTGKGKTPSQVMLRLREFPYMLKTAETQLTAAEFAALHQGLLEPADDAAWLALNTNVMRDYLTKDAHAAASERGRDASPGRPPLQPPGSWLSAWKKQSIAMG